MWFGARSSNRLLKKKSNEYSELIKTWNFITS
jgi:hypothetical protein